MTFSNYRQDGNMKKTRSIYIYKADYYTKWSNKTFKNQIVFEATVLC